MTPVASPAFGICAGLAQIGASLRSVPYPSNLLETIGQLLLEELLPVLLAFPQVLSGTPIGSPLSHLLWPFQNGRMRALVSSFGDILFIIPVRKAFRTLSILSPFPKIRLRSLSPDEGGCALTQTSPASLFERAFAWRITRFSSPSDGPNKAHQLYRR